MKIRADQLLVDRGLVSSRSKAQALIMAGQVFTSQKRLSKAGELIEPAEELRIQEELPYVSRGGVKLAHALETFSPTVRDRVALDVGASTGGFTDCLLQAGARKVYALDVGYGQLDWKLRQDPRVVVIERTNIRYWEGEEIQEVPDLVTIDVSFISLKKVIPPIETLLKGLACRTLTVIALVKPQFEVGREDVGSGGVVRKPDLIESVMADIKAFLVKRGWELTGTAPSPIKGPKGNQEYLLVAELGLSL